MAEDDKIKYRDIIEPDDSIERLIKQLGELNEQYEIMVNAIRAGADRIVRALKQASGATSEGRKSIDEAAASTSRLERAQNELKFALSKTGKQVAWLKAQTSDANKSSVERNRYIKQAISSYDRLKTDLKQMVSLYKSLTDAEREDSNMGRQLLDDIINLKNQIKALDDQMKPHIQTLSEVEKAEQRLSYLQSAEGQRLLDLKAKISELTSARRQHKAVIDPLAQAQEKLAYAQSDENKQLRLYSTQIKEANQVAQLQAQIANSAEGSYNRLSAQYSLNKIRLNQMSGAEREATETGKKLEAQTYEIYQQMIKLQEATGNYRLSVGHYQKTWDGLGISISQIVRELPAAAVSLNTFFLGISNNIPMVVDEINRLRLQNKLLQAEGKATVSITKSITKALFGWNTALVVVLTVLSMYGGQIIEWIGNLFKGRQAVISLSEALDNINEELKTTNASFGSNIVTLKQLQQDWKNLKSTAEKTQWIKDNKSEFDKLGISVSDVIDAENVFVNNTEAVINALKLRAKAAAAQELATKKYEEALVARNKAEIESQKGPSASDRLKNWFAQAALRSGGDTPGYIPQVNIETAERISPEGFKRDRIKDLNDEADAAEKTGDAYFDLAAGYKAAADAELNAAGISVNVTGDSEKSGGKRGSRQRDLTDTINRMALSVQKKYEQSITELERDEYAKRRKEAIDTANAKIRELNEVYRKNEDYINDEKNRYKDLTEDEIKLIEDSQKRIVSTIINTQNQLSYDLEQIENDRKINELKILDDTIQLRLSAIKEGSLEEFQLKLESIENARKIALLENAKLPESEQQSGVDINAYYDKQRSKEIANFDILVFDQMQELREAEFNSEKHTDNEITKFKLEAEKERWEMLIKIAEAGGLDWSQVQIETAKNTIKGIDRELSELDNFVVNIGKKGLGASLLESMGFDNDQIDAIIEATNIIVEQLQEIADAEVELAEKAVEAAEERVEAAQKAYDAEVEGRNNGYANNVATAKKELEQEKKNQAQKQKLLEEAQKRQEAINAVTQASSLITASANLWSSLSPIPIVGSGLAIAAIAAMWASFAAAKIKARQVAGMTEQYGEGGIEFLEGGSHASGNDIDLGITNKRKRKMKAEGGETLAIINKKQTRKYKKILPDIIDSFNKGVFEDKYINAFADSADMNISIHSSDTRPIDISNIEKDVHNIKKQNETRYYTLPNGTVVIQYKNIKRIIKN